MDLPRFRSCVMLFKQRAGRYTVQQFGGSRGCPLLEIAAGRLPMVNLEGLRVLQVLMPSRSTLDPLETIRHDELVAAAWPIRSKLSSATASCCI